MTDPEIIDTRLQAHWAAQLVAAVGATLLPRAKDDSHAALAWSEADHGLVGAALPGGARAALDLETLALVAGGQRLALDGHTLDEGRAWLEARVGAPLRLPAYDMPDHDVGRGGRFRAGPASPALRSRLSDLYAAAELALEDVTRGTRHASLVRCWPHHFDIATLLDLGEGRSIGVGMSPGDATFDDAYWYVTPWPRPGSTAKLAVLDGGGTWHDGEWFGAVRRDGGASPAFLSSALSGVLALF